MSSRIIRLGLVGVLSVLSCERGQPDVLDPPAPSAATCLDDPLALQNASSFTLGETFYLPLPRSAAGCPANAQWEVLSAPGGSQAKVIPTGAPQPRLTPDVAGLYTLRVAGIQDSQLLLTVVARTPSERFANHYLTPLFGLAPADDELWVANGAAYTVTKLWREKATGPYQVAQEIPVGAWPAAVVADPRLPYVLVAQRGSDTLGFVDRKRGVLQDALWVGDEPTGLALAADKQRVYVSSATGREIIVVSLDTRQVMARIPVGFDPRALALSGDGRWLYVASYRSGNLQDGPMGMRKPEDDQDVWVIDTATHQVAHTFRTLSADLRALAVSADSSELYIAATDGDTLPPQNDPTAKSFVHEALAVNIQPSAADLGKVLRRADLTRQPTALAAPFVNPAGVLVMGDTLWLSAEASDELVVLDRRTLAETMRIKVGSGPRHLVALSPSLVAVHCFQRFEVWIVDTTGKVVQTIQSTVDPRPPAVTLGERIFNRPGAGFAANHACASCHIETQNDGMVWRFGPRSWHNVRPLQLLAATTPLEWGAYVSSADNFGFQGPSSIVARPVNTQEAEGLAAFLGSLIGAPRANSHTRLDGSYTDSALRGQALFVGKLGCVGCHTPPLYTNRQYIPMGKSGEAADVPSLLGVYRHGVYLVNGRSRSLEAAVDVALRFVGASLSEVERQDLLSFLRQLTPKGAAPLGIWPDIDSNSGVAPTVEPWVAFADPIDDSGQRPSQHALDEAVRHLTLTEVPGSQVDVDVRLDTLGTRAVLTPKQRLAAGKTYRFCAVAGLHFRSGGVLEADRCSTFSVAMPAIASLQGGFTLSINLPPMGPMPPPPPLTFALDIDGEVPGGLAATLALSPTQKQRLWLRLDGQRFLMQPFALPVGPGIADAGQVTGRVTGTGDGPAGKLVTRIEGTLRLGAPGINVPGIAFVLASR